MLFIWQPQQNLLIVLSTFPPSIDDAIYVNSTSKFSMPLVMSQSNRFLSEIQWHDFLLMPREFSFNQIELTVGFRRA